ncbi:hypothetical protein FDP08_03415 [Marinobacter panjinensis]|uniref:NodB homology domain-containing protein n=1 Tax=Marinobacter panjinensis TaxID=2576384 RepID=A0A4U6R1G1_9GAMM|nr:polysaccharide deacetylase family protein [Marinobacter panjinensis]MCR8915820.1 polysaccharide deacetylase family protein [Marinobacter panjinensis]TKV67203.1 hypothetical protein FDP08_03415 [Marinobacter panjinensis]
MPSVKVAKSLIGANERDDMAIPALMYHHISPTPGAHTVSPENFRIQLQWLADSGIRTISASEFDQWRQGSLTLEGPSVLLTFDDGWLDNWVYALPLLKEFNAKAVFFVVTSWPGEGTVRRDLGGSGWEAPTHEEAMASVKGSAKDGVVMRWSELLASKASGLVELASHSHTHGSWWDNQRSWPMILDALREDLYKSQIILSHQQGEPSNLFCWPKGQFGLEMIEVAKEVGFEVQFSTLRGCNSPAPFRLVRRINAENQGQEWISSRIRVYRDPLRGSLLGLAHQTLQRLRMQQKFQAIAPKDEFRFPFLSLI